MYLYNMKIQDRIKDFDNTGYHRNHPTKSQYYVVFEQVMDNSNTH